MKDFNKLISNMKDSIASWDYYTNFENVYKNVDSIKVELNILNSLIGSKNIEEDFKKLLIDYPNILKAIPILLAKREKEIKINDSQTEYNFNFTTMNYSPNEYVMFMKKTGLFDLIQNHLINNLVDYVTGIEVGMDTNARKNRTGHAMEDIIESYLKESGFILNRTYFKEMTKSEIEEQFGLDLSTISNDGKTEKRFDFVINYNNHIFACEVNFYATQGSKLNETARSYKTLALESQSIDNFTFVWFTDGIGWLNAKHNLEETYDVMDTIYNINDLEHEGLLKLLDNYLNKNNK